MAPQMTPPTFAMKSSNADDPPLCAIFSVLAVAARVTGACGRAAGRRGARQPTRRAEPSAQRNFTDPDSRIMKNSDGAFVQAYNGQAVVDADHQIIVAADVTACASDVPSLLPMLDQAAGNAGHAPAQALADAGYCSADDLAALADRQAGGGCTDVLVATGRLPTGGPPRCPTSCFPTRPPSSSRWRTGCAPSPVGPPTPAGR